jgi:hypothetical protein
MSMRWRTKTEVTEKLPSKLYAEFYHLISIDDDALKTHSEIHYNILHSEMEGFRLIIPEGMNVLSVTGEAVGEWQEVDEQDERTILIPFTYSKKGIGTIRMATESTFADSNMTAVFSGVRMAEAIRETGFIGIELNTSAEARVTENEGVERIPVQKLPEQLQGKSAKPLILGFKYLKHPFNLVLDIEKHEKIPVPVATINSASAVTLFTEDGKIVNRLIYDVRNSSKQFLELQLPEEAEVWSVFVGKQPAESSINADGHLLVPLIRSSSTNNNLDTFPVEIIYCVVEDEFSLFDTRNVSLPEADLLTSQLIWSVYLPNDYNYMYFTSTLEKEEIIRGLNLFSSPKREYDKNVMKRLLTPSADSIREDRAQAVGELSDDELQEAYKNKDYMSKFRNSAIPQEQISSQVGAELEFGGRLEGLQEGLPQPPVSAGASATGVLPIQIHVPTGGQVYRFAKTIITPDEPLNIQVTYSRRIMLTFVKWTTYILLLIAVYLKRKALAARARLLKEKMKVLVNSYKKHEPAFKQAMESRMTPFILLAIAVFFLTVSAMLALLAFLLLALSLVMHLFNYLERKRQSQKVELQA